MIRGYFSESDGINRPFVRCLVYFPSFPNTRAIAPEFLIDTGADRSLLSPREAIGIGLDFSILGRGPTSRGVGGETSTLLVESMIYVEGYTIPLTLSIPEAQHPIPSVLGRDFIANFALFLEERTDRVLLLDETEVEVYGLATLGNS